MEREGLLQELAAQKCRREELLGELEKYKACDPEVMEQMKQQTHMAREAANRWTGEVMHARIAKEAANRWTGEVMHARTAKEAANRWTGEVMHARTHSQGGS